METLRKKFFALGLFWIVMVMAGCGNAVKDRDMAESGQSQGRQKGEGQEEDRGNGGNRENKESKDEREDKGDKEEVSLESAFTYMDSTNGLYLWRQGGEAPVLLTDKFFVYTQDMADAGSADDFDMDIDLWDLVSYAPDRSKIYFPSEIKMLRSGSSRLAAVYDLYSYTAEGRKELVAEDVVKYQVDDGGKVWFSKIVDKDSMVLSREDGEGQEEIGEMGSSAEAGFQVSGDGSYVVFQGKDGGLYGKGQEEEAVKLAEQAEGDFFLSADKRRCVYRTGNGVGIADIGEEGADGTVEMEKEGKVYLLDENAERVLVVEEEKVTYDEVLENDMGTDGASGQLWELFGEAGVEYGIRKGRLQLYDAEAGQGVVLAEGYLMDSVEYDEMEPIRGFYYFEMIPEDAYQKVSASRYCSPYTAEEVVEAYGYQGDTALEGNELYWYGQAQGYLVCNGELKLLEGIELSGQNEVRRTYNKSDGKFYVRVIRSIPRYEGQLDFMDEAVAGGEDVYEFDADGNYRKVAETVQQALVIGDSLYYLRNAASMRFQRLYRLGEEGYLAQADAINLDQMRKSVKTGELFYLTGSYGVYSKFPGDLNCYDGIGNKKMAEQVYQFMLYGDNCVAALQNTVDVDSDEYFYMVTMGDGNQWGRLLVFEDGEEKALAEEVIWLMRIQG